ncbi:RIO1 family regulatory kinase/ATPase [Haloarculaceae archaeon H-GB11]|nr:lipopolysaccharide kinase InaA family protein [Haloarculaceae archaeon H-GB1-1]MEA5387535.1 RIO1 family regulatory kinase/ATPase [Haloarculaceae archaeon H-GB11]
MAFRRLLRGHVPWSHLESITKAVMERYDLPEAEVTFLETDNWLSTPFVINDKLFVKVVSAQNSMVHALLTAGRNLGAFSSGREGFFEHVGDPVQMAEHELDATRRMRDLGVNAPEPLEAFEHEGLGVLVLEYLPEFRTLCDLDGEEVAEHAVELFALLSKMHDASLAHGDLRSENVLVSQGELYFIDATSVREDGIADARSYDLACALAVLAPLMGGREAVAAALEVYDEEELLAASEFLDFISMRPDHDFEVTGIRGEIEKRATST